MPTTTTDPFDAVLNLTILAPCPETDRVMGRLVRTIIDEPRLADGLNDATIRRVQAVCAATETEMELFWSRRITTAPDPAMALAAFPYLDNYHQLVEREVRLLADSGLTLTKISRVLVVGSGPLPMTAVELWRQTGATVDQVDSSVRAVRLGQAFGSVSGLPGRTYLADGASVRPGASYDVILIAALAGDTAAAKQAIIDNLRPDLKPGGRFVIRSARGSRELLYPAIAADAFKGVRLLRSYHPDDHVINSVFVYS